MGANRWTIVREVLIPEALPGIIAGFTVTVITLIGASAMAGAIGAGGLGDLAIRYGYQRFETQVMIAVVIILIIMVCGIQWVGDRLVNRLDKAQSARLIRSGIISSSRGSPLQACFRQDRRRAPRNSPFLSGP